MVQLDNILLPDDIRGLSIQELESLAGQIRNRIIEVTSRNGGHVGPNLGVVELTLALHRVFHTPEDKIVFDVSHQGYVHKLLTGRNGEKFDNLRQNGGYSGFLQVEESDHDSFGAGHAGTALSAALGMAIARDRRRSSEHVVAVIGDASLTCGITMEALNNISVSTNRLIVILNDNEWSIDRNVGAIARYLNEIIRHPLYNRIDAELKRVLRKLPMGSSIVSLGRKWKKETKDFIVPSSLFETFGLRYLGPIDGHDLDALQENLEFTRTADSPVLLHVITQKGKGYSAAQDAPEKFHGASPFNIDTGESEVPAGPPLPSYQEVFGKSLLRFARSDSKIMAITAAMPGGTGLKYIRQELPEQYMDVGIAEEHAVVCAAGLAIQGMKPVVAIYSTFLQRSVDPIIHDVCLQKLPVVFCLDRAGLSPNDGPTHHGLFDIAYLKSIPGTTIMQPRHEAELADMLWTALHMTGPVFIRYPKGASGSADAGNQHDPRMLELGKAETISGTRQPEIAFWALGCWVEDALALAETVERELGVAPTVVNARFAKPLDTQLLAEHAESARLIVTFEDHVKTGGFGASIIEYLNDQDLAVPVERISWPDQFIPHGSTVSDLRACHELTNEAILQRITGRFAKVDQREGRAKTDAHKGGVPEAEPVQRERPVRSSAQ